MRANLQLVYVLIAFGLGGTQALQAVMLGSMGRMRGPIEAAWISILGTVAVLGIGLASQAFTGRAPALPMPFNNGWAPALVGIVAGAMLLLTLRGIPGGYAITGMLAGPYIIAAAFLAPRLGVGLFFGAVIAGQLLAGVMFDHTGAFGLAQKPLDLSKAAGIVALLAGVVLIRGWK